MNIKYFQKITIFILLLFTAEVLADKNYTTSQIAKQYSSSVVTIVALDENDQPMSLGSAFIINDDGDVATNYHVLEGSTKAILKTTNGDKGIILNVKSYSLELDLIIAETTLKNIKPVSLGDSDVISIGEDIVAIGNPAGLEGSISKGIISGIRNIDSYKYIQITAPISPGSSGGPVFKLSGKVIGIATACLEFGQSLNFAMPINYLNSMKIERKKLSSLPKKLNNRYLKKENSYLQLVDIHYEYNSDYFKEHLFRIFFSIKNSSYYSINNILLFFVYKNFSGEVISYSSKKYTDSILPQLAQQFSHNHQVRYFKNGEIEIRILDYEINRAPESSPADLLFK